MITRLGYQKGFLSIAAIILILVMGFLGMALTFILISGSASTANFLQASKALYLAEAGLEHGTRRLEAAVLTNRNACSGLSINNTLGSGAYSVTTSGPFYVSSPTTLNGALTASAATIPVTSTANYEASGRLMIEKELINYAGISGNNFIGVVRGVDGSVAVAHPSGSRVGQFQCSLNSQGGVPSLTAPANPGSPSGKRVLQDKVQLQEAWAVGNTNSGNSTLFHWNRPTELQWNNASVAGAVDLNGVYFLSYADGWIVGDINIFGRWSGTSWEPVSTGLPSVEYFGVYCTSGNACHVVGNDSGSTPVIGFWNGSSWARLTPTGSTARTRLRSVHCSSASDCWAVGDNTSGGRFYQWNGSGWVGINTNTLSAYTYNSVFCNSTNDCWAVGANATFARKSGASWTNFATGLPSVQYNGVFCNSSSDCWAVGNTSGGQKVIGHWNGSAWSRNTSNLSPGVNLRSVTCAGTNDCWAVGVSSVFLHWDGSSWVTFSTSGLPSVQLNAVSIVSPRRQPQAAWQETFA